ncbi:hypothetical protein PAT3040_06146 [Paenibacillus agaridevorans]|uniref:Uncharacterized protein n=1 Tax=Paenibacillus agaridevorans TaxID=171404 RepID=A0A2R5EYZ6_9BACL|nr:hypothetical protein [Paenibacillus agaridevorans]GBG11345.1 hypothetical protein PAT3040_06146 [Paenibacillus agaridevorans]
MNGKTAMTYLAKPTTDEKKQAQRLLRNYMELKRVVEDYKEHEELIKTTLYESERTRRLDGEDLYGNRTANAVQVAHNQKLAAEECELVSGAIERAVGMIRDDEARQAVTLRYLKGHSYSETLYYMRRGEKSSTLDRRLNDGVSSVASTLKLWGLLAWEGKA